MAAEDLNADDWLFPKASDQKAATAVEALKRAQLYLIFETGDGKTLLKTWQDFVRGMKLAPNASVQEYAAANAVREFVEGVSKQIDFAHNRGGLPQ